MIGNRRGHATDRLGIGKSDAEWRDSAQTAALGVNAGFTEHIVFTEIRVGDYVPKSRLTCCSVCRQTASMEAGIDCILRSNSC
jgi:hypothetical protein